MPPSRADRQAVLTIMDWAFYDPAAELSAPDRVREYRVLCGEPWTDETQWRKAFDLALDIWKAARDRMREAF